MLPTLGGLASNTSSVSGSGRFPIKNHARQPLAAPTGSPQEAGWRRLRTVLYLFNDCMNTLTRTGVALVLLVGMFALTWFGYYPHSPLGRQEANLRLPEKHQPRVEGSLRRMKGAEGVRVGVHTGLGGSLCNSSDVMGEPPAIGLFAGLIALGVRSLPPQMAASPSSGRRALGIGR
jgi:hypothetical protein